MKKCEKCGVNKASVEITKNINGKKSHYFLCEECAEKSGELNINTGINFTDIFSGLFFSGVKEQPVVTKQKVLECENCGLTYDEFLQIGKFGCSKCYNAFSEKLEPIMKRLHGNAKHINEHFENNAKVQDSDINNMDETPENSEFEKLKNELKNAIDNEKYEEAAQIRDRMKKYKR